VRDEVAPACDGIVIHPNTTDEERISFAEAKRRGIVVEDPGIQQMIDRA